MGLFNFGVKTSSESTDFKNIVARYQRLRPVRMRLNNELAGRLSRDVLNEGAKRLGMLRRGVFVFDNEDEMAVLMDYCIYNVFRKRRNAVDQYLCDCPPDPESDELVCLRAMQHAAFALIAVLRVERGVGCIVRNLFTADTQLLVDMGFSTTAQPGAVLATRLLDFGDYIATSGAALPLGLLDDDELDDWQRQFRGGLQGDDFDPAPLIRDCLQHGASSHIRYENPGSERRPSTGSIQPRVENPAKRRQELAKRQATKAAGKRRCKCGSGKMHKNCCGKR